MECSRTQVFNTNDTGIRVQKGGEGNGFATCVVPSITIEDLLVSFTDADDASVCLLTGPVRLWLTSPMNLVNGFASRLVRNLSAQV